MTDRVDCSEFNTNLKKEYDDLMKAFHENRSIMKRTIDDCKTVLISLKEVTIEKQLLEKQKAAIERKYEQMIEKHQQEIRLVKAELKDARDSLKREMNECCTLKGKLKEAETKINVTNSQQKKHSNDLLLREVQQKRSETIPFDKTSDSLMDDTCIEDITGIAKQLPIPCRKRNLESTKDKSSQLLTEGNPPKRSSPSRPSLNESTVAQQLVPPTPMPRRSQRLGTRKSISDSSILDPVGFVGRYQNRCLPRTKSSSDLRKRWAKDELSLKTKGHNFKRVNTIYKLCDVCNSSANIIKAAVKCIDCHQHVHQSCQADLPVPCVPRNETVLKTPKRGKLMNVGLKDYSCQLPLIASPIVLCVVALENQGLYHEGLYRIPASRADVQPLLEDLKTSKTIPKLSDKDPYVLCDVIKRFLEDIKDSLIPKTSREECLRAAHTGNYKSLKTSVIELPLPNRDTLAFLVLHWQKVAELQEHNQMTKANIARCVASVVMGDKKRCLNGIKTKEICGSDRVLEALLDIEPEFYKKFIYEDSKKMNKKESGLLLGPISGDTPVRMISRPLTEYFEKL